MQEPQNKEKPEISSIEDIKKRLAEDFELEQLEAIEKSVIEQEPSVTEEQEQAIRRKIEEEVRLIESTPELKKQAETRSQELKNSNAEGKLKGLFSISETKGIAFAVATARAMDDPYILDAFHDLVIKEGLHKK